MYSIKIFLKRATSRYITRGFSGSQRRRVYISIHFLVMISVFPQSAQRTQHNGKHNGIARVKKPKTEHPMGNREMRLDLPHTTHPSRISTFTLSYIFCPILPGCFLLTEYCLSVRSVLV